ncbi:MAG: helix-turn-helix transcriptional regulator [Polyangiales bacterium]
MSSTDVISANLPILRELRDRMAQHELADRVGVSRRTIARLESGEVADPGVDLMRRIAHELGVSLSLLTDAPLAAVTLPLPKHLCTHLLTPSALDAITQTLRTHPE